MIKAHSLYEGSYSVDKTKVFIPFDSNTDDPKDRPGSLFIQVQPFLIQTNNGLILIDTGLGQNTPEGQMIVIRNIENLGFKADDIRIVLLSHLHKDHISGAVDLDKNQLTFPNATYYIQQKEWSRVLSSDEEVAELGPILNILEQSGQIKFLDGDGFIEEEIEYQVSGAHTPYHQVFHIKSEGISYFFGGDVLPEPEEIFRSFIAKYDYDGKLARDLRAKYWSDGAPQKWVFLFYHSKTIKIGQSITKSDGTYKLIDVATNN